MSSANESSFKWSGLRKNELEGQYDITYSISASAYSKKGLQASTTKTVPILPVSQVQPPLSPSDFPGEYFYAASTPQPSKVSLSRAPSFKLEVGAQEPEAIVLDAHQTFSTGSTTVPFTIKALPRSSSILDTGSLPRQCLLKARLVSKTLITPDRIEEKVIPTLDQAMHGRDASLRMQKSDEQEFTLSIPPWYHVAAGRWPYLKGTCRTSLTSFRLTRPIRTNQLLLHVQHHKRQGTNTYILHPSTIETVRD